MKRIETAPATDPAAEFVIESAKLRLETNSALLGRRLSVSGQSARELSQRMLMLRRPLPGIRPPDLTAQRIPAVRRRLAEKTEKPAAQTVRRLLRCFARRLPAGKLKTLRQQPEPFAPALSRKPLSLRPMNRN